MTFCWKAGRQWSQTSSITPALSHSSVLICRQKDDDTALTVSTWFAPLVYEKLAGRTLRTGAERRTHAVDWAQSAPQMKDNAPDKNILRLLQRQ